MAAPTGLSSESGPEPVTPEAAAAGPLAPAPRNAEPDAPEPGTPGPGTPEPGPRGAGETTLEDGAAAEDITAGPDAGPHAGVVAEAGPHAEGADAGSRAEGADAGARAEAAGAGPGAAGPGYGIPADQPPPRRYGRLVAAAVVIVVVAAAAAAGVLFAVTHGFKPKTVVSYQPAAVFALKAGDCVNSSADGLSATVVPCTTPHNAEVFATFSLAGSSWPGSAAVKQQAGAGCQARLAGYLNPALLNAGLDQEFVYPDQTAWEAGVRTTVCEVSSSTGPLTGSVRNTG
jgi:hypothetical protein